MHQSARFFLCLGLVSQLFFACKKDDDKVTPITPPTSQPSPEEPVTQPVSQPGYFMISSIDQGSANARKEADTYSSEFDLGRLLSSDKFLFMIANGGDEPIFDVTLTTDNTPFEISPKNIKVVPGRKGSAIVPLLTVGVTHGYLLRGVGSAPILPTGINKATIMMKGKTLSGKDTIEVDGKFLVTVDAIVVDAKALSAGIDAVKDSTNSFVVEPAKIVQLMNSGSVPIHATIVYSRQRIYTTGPNKGYSFEGSHQYTTELDLQPNEAKDITQVISPIKHYEEDGYDFTEYYYDGFTSIQINPVTQEGAPVKNNYFRLVSK